jgi:hypothetical protein
MRMLNRCVLWSMLRRRLRCRLRRAWRMLHVVLHAVARVLQCICLLHGIRLQHVV